MPGETTTCAIHQPNFLPRLSTLAKLYAADHWVVLDDVQFTRRDYQHRCRLIPLATRPTNQREMPQQWLSLPVHLPHGQASLINEVSLVDAKRERRRIPGVLYQFYRGGADPRALSTVAAQIAAALESSNRLLDVSEASTLALLNLLGWPGTHSRSSDFTVRRGRSERLTDLTARIGADLYLCGRGGAKYLDERPFADQGITVSYIRPVQDPAAPTDPRVTCLHTLMTLGVDELRSLLIEHGRLNSQPNLATGV